MADITQTASSSLLDRLDDAALASVAPSQVELMRELRIKQKPGWTSRLSPSVAAFVTNKKGMAGVIILLAMILFSILAPMFSEYNPHRRAGKPHVAPGYDADVLPRWADALFPDSPDFDPPKQSAQAQSRQFGYNNDYVGYIPIDGSAEHGLLVVNHEYTNPHLMFPGIVEIVENDGTKQAKVAPLSKEQVLEMREKHGVYMAGSGRINVAGLTMGNIDKFVAAIAEVAA